MAIKEKPSLQLHFDPDNPLVQKVMSALSLISRKKKYVVLIALDEFFEKYGLYGTDEKYIRKFLNNYEYIRNMRMYPYPRPGPALSEMDPVDTPPIYGTAEKRSRPKKASADNDSGIATHTSENATTVNTSAEKTRSAFGEPPAKIPYGGNPEISEEQKARMQSMLKMFGA